VDAAACIDLGTVQLRSGKFVVVWAAEGDFDPETAEYGTFEMEWPRGSGRLRTFPEIDRAEWFDPDTARRKLNPAQTAFVDRLEALLAEVPNL
jgi:predicted NUDIX family NTP pyrophosphohydrolase